MALQEEENLVLGLVARIPTGYSEGMYHAQKYGISKQVFNGGKSFKIYAEALGAKDFVSLNLYLTPTQVLLKPCEMPKEKVMAFLEEVQLLDD